MKLYLALEFICLELEMTADFITMHIAIF